jgi:hypothetical protein
MNKYKNVADNPFNWEEAILKIEPSGFIDETDIFWKEDKNEKIYKINSLNFRSDEFVENRDLVFSGCSYTFGQGVVNDGIWGNIVSKELNLKSYNLGLPGKSVQSIVNNLFNYFKIIDHPKILLCLFPEFTRMDMWSERDHMVSRKNFEEAKREYNKYTLVLQDREYEKISKQPYIAEKIIPMELPFALSIQYIKFLEMYCKAKDIKFLWGTWSQTESLFLKSNKETFLFNNFVDLESYKWHQRYEDKRKIRYHQEGLISKNHTEDYMYHDKECINATDCHQELKHIYGKNFDLAMDTGESDYDLKNHHGHCGVHQHIHYAELFVEALNNYDERFKSNDQ